MSVFRPGVVYRVAIQGCDKSFGGRSDCTNWENAVCGTPSKPCTSDADVRRNNAPKPPSPRMPQTPTRQKSPDVCASGYVWREARPTDHVCVTPESRALVRQENSRAPQRGTAGAYGPHTCIQGYVWREAFQGDDVCVTPKRRDQVREENSVANSRRASHRID
jgi:hypothetical protein